MASSASTCDPRQGRRWGSGGLDVDLTTRIGPLTLPNPIMTASGTAGHGAELAAYFDLSALGAVVVKSLSPDPWAGNPPPRVHPAAAGMLNSVGLQNPGVARWLDEELPPLAATGARIVVSIWGHTASDYGRAKTGPWRRRPPGRPGPAPPRPPPPGAVSGPAVQATAGAPRPRLRPPATAIVAVEANVSCPNVEDRRRMFAHSAPATARRCARWPPTRWRAPGCPCGPSSAPT